MGEGQKTQLYVLNLREKAYKLRQETLDMEHELELNKMELEAIKEELFETKVRRIAMQEIANCSFEEMCRNCGIVKSFHGVDKDIEKERL